MSKFIKTMLLIGTLVLVAGCASERKVLQVPTESTLIEHESNDYSSGILNRNLNSSTDLIAVGDTLTYQTALAKTLLENPQLQSYAWQVRVKEAERIQAALLPNPELEAEMENFGGTGPFEGYDSRETTIRLSQKVLLGADRMKRKRLAGLTTELANWDYETQRLNTLTGLTQAYTSALEAQLQWEQQKELLDVARQFYESVSAQVTAGKVSKLEQTKAQVELSRARIELENRRNSMESAFTTLASFWGSDRVLFKALNGELEIPESIPNYQSVAEFIERNPDIARWTTEIQQREASLSLQRSKAIPDIKISAGYRRMEDLDAEAALVGVSIPIPFFDRNQGNVKAARYELNRAETQRESALIEAQKALQNTYNNLQAALYEVEQLNAEVLPGAETAYEAAQIGYRQGKFDFLEVLDAQRTLFTSRTRYVQALAELNRAIAEVERLIGTPLNEISTN
ncbi:TolC family protein [Gracilimonas mengyeensis]|uniref:Outer membrane protein, cobalt-zinc-cadmium efflux system n=1 Tax=Gracilimonas mengyeensis TaxID=1302730 RepID=A0A521EW17_9BACT|nr:TolC family protein [Gracilimonas mengyeensis]SMO87290.1 outer membrane protein, cobalt-zinc-cadmium efflux system [Gracilimonas mengyeensis]